MTFRDQIEYAATSGTLKLSRVLPKKAVYSIFRGFALLFHATSARRRTLSLRNTAIAFPERNIKERKALVRQSYINVSEAMAFNALVMAGRLSNEELLDHVETDDWDKLAKIIDTSEKGILTYSAHLGNWEMMAQYIAIRLDKPVNMIARKISNQLLEDRIAQPLRERFNINVFYKKNAMMKLLKALKRGELSGLLIDQRLNLRQGIPIEFFGRETGTTATPALLQIRFGITTVPIFMVKTEPHKSRLLVGDPVPWDDNGKPMEEQVLELTRLHQKTIEDMIRKYPDQWFWMHNRWGLPKEER